MLPVPACDVVDDNAAGGMGDDTGNAIIIDAQDRILVAGSSWGGPGTADDMVVWRLQ